MPFPTTCKADQAVDSPTARPGCVPPGQGRAALCCARKRRAAPRPATVPAQSRWAEKRVSALLRSLLLLSVEEIRRAVECGENDLFYGRITDPSRTAPRVWRRLGDVVRWPVP